MFALLFGCFFEDRIKMSTQKTEHSSITDLKHLYFPLDIMLCLVDLGGAAVNTVLDFLQRQVLVLTAVGAAPIHVCLENGKISVNFRQNPNSLP